MAPEPAEYLLANNRVGADERLQAIAELYDGWTLGHLADLGLGPSWRCWEVGAGSALLSEAMAERVRPDGWVLATDIDVSALHTNHELVEVRRHDVAADPPPADSFELAHCRLVLVHLPQRDVALGHMVSALRHGGWLMVEDADPALQPLGCLDPQSPAEYLANRLRQDFRSLLAERGADLSYGRKLPRLLRDSGLVDVEADAYFPLSRPPCRVLEVATMRLVGPQLVESGLATRAEIDGHVANVATGLVDLAQPPLVTAWGRRA